MTEILLADHHRIVRAGVRRILEAREDFAVVAEAGDGEQAVALVLDKRPDVAVMEIGMPGLSGLEAIRRIRQSGASTRCVVLSGHESGGPVEEALRAGASGYVPKSVAPNELLDAIDSVRRGRFYLSPCIAPHVVAAVTRPGEPCGSGISDLTNRERDVLRRIAEGLRSREIADALHLSLKTVETHRSNLMNKLGIHNVANLVRFAIREGLVTP